MQVCVNCGSEALDKQGRPVEQSFDAVLRDKSGLVKLIECEQCGENVDKYIEYEGCLVLLDLALQHQPAYRHTLINQNHGTLILRMVFLTLIVDGYCRWASEAAGEEFFEREYEFYVKFGLALTSLAVLVSTCLLLTAVGHCLRVREGQPSYLKLTYGLLLSYCARFLQLGALLWGSTSTQFLWVFIDLLYFLTTCNVLKTVSALGGVQATAVALVSHAALHVLELHVL